MVYVKGLDEANLDVVYVADYPTEWVQQNPTVEPPTYPSTQPPTQSPTEPPTVKPSPDPLNLEDIKKITIGGNCGKEWNDIGAEMHEIEDKVWECTSESAPADTVYQIRFLINDDDKKGFMGTFSDFGQTTDATYQVKDYDDFNPITFILDSEKEVYNLTFRLDLTDYNPQENSGAKFTITKSMKTEYHIYNESSWNTFCEQLQDVRYNGFRGCTVYLEDNIWVSNMAGSTDTNGIAFEGKFEGNGKTLQFYHTAEENYTAPFRCVQGTEQNHATISNLTVKSNISSNNLTNNKHMGGLIALQKGYVDVVNCHAEVDINNTVEKTAEDKDLYPAGLVSQSAGELTVTGCTVEGKIATNGKYAGGFVGIVQRTASIEDSVSSVTITSSTDGDGTHGGLVGVTATNSKMTVKGCVFNGELSTSNNTIKCSGFLGWRQSTATIYDSLFIPKTVTIGKDNSATFARNKVDTYNCYYSYVFNDGKNYLPYLDSGNVTPKKYNNGQLARTITSGNNKMKLEISGTGEVAQYKTSGITAYANSSGLQYGDTIYAGEDDVVMFTPRPSDGYRVKSLSVNAGTLTKTGNAYTMTMPDENVIVSAEFKLFKGYSLSLNGAIDVNFYLELTSEQAETAKVTFQYDGKEPYEADIVYDSAKKLYKATCDVSAAYMAHDITAKLYLDGTLEEEDLYSVKQYADYILEHSMDYMKAVPLIKAMLNYGTNAQEYFGVNTENPANARLSDNDKKLADVTIHKSYETNLPDSITFVGATLSLRSNTTLSLYFKSEETLEFSCGDLTVENVRNKAYQVARIRNIRANDVQNDFTLSVKSGDNTYSVTYSPLNYIKNAVNSSDTKLQNVAKALYSYSAMTVDYFNKYQINYNVNGGTETVTPDVVSKGESFRLPIAVSEEKYIFSGWYTAAESGTKVGDAGANYTPSADITLYAHWTEKSFVVQISTSNSSTIVTVNGVQILSGGRVVYGSVVKVELSFSSGNDQKFSIHSNAVGLDDVPYYANEVCTLRTTSQKQGTYYFKMPEGDVSISSSSVQQQSPCVVKGTLITLADGTVKPVERVVAGDELLVWNLETGRYESSPAVFNDADPKKEYKIIHTCFSDGTDVQVVWEHGFFDITLGKYVYITENTLNDYIGHEFVKQGTVSENTWNVVTLKNVWIETKNIEVYSPVTYRHLCYYTNGILSMPGGISGMFNIFAVDTDTMTYNQEKMQADCETYGLFTYEDFEGIVPDKIYDAFNGAWLKVAIGKEMLTWENIEYLAERYAKYF